MKKTIIFIAFFVALTTLIGMATASTDRAVDGIEGAKAPVFKVERADSLVLLNDLKGQWVLLQFWTSADALSRLAVKEYSRINCSVAAEGSSAARFRHLAVNLDRSQRLFDEIVRRDGLDAKSQFHVGDAAMRATLAGSYHLDNGMKAFLIDPDGQIVAVDPSADTISRLLPS